MSRPVISQFPPLSPPKDYRILPPDCAHYCFPMAALYSSRHGQEFLFCVRRTYWFRAFPSSVSESDTFSLYADPQPVLAFVLAILMLIVITGSCCPSSPSLSASSLSSLGRYSRDFFVLRVVIPCYIVHCTPPPIRHSLGIHYLTSRFSNVRRGPLSCLPSHHPICAKQLRARTPSHDII